MDERVVEYREPREPFGRRVGRLITLLSVVGVIAFVFVITQRFSTETLAFIFGGLSIFAVCLTVAVLGIWVYSIRSRSRSQRPEQPPYPQFQIPPIIMQMPQPSQPALPSYGQDTGWDWQGQPTRKRAWVEVGNVDMDE